MGRAPAATPPPRTRDRTLAGSRRRVGPEPEDGEGRQRDERRGGLALVSLALGRPHAARAAVAGPAEPRGVGVEHDPPLAAPRQPDAIVVTWHRREVGEAR